MLDVILIIAAGILQLIVTLYAVDISVRDNRKKNAGVIGAVGLAAIALTAVAGYHSYQYQEHLIREVSSIKQQL